MPIRTDSPPFAEFLRIGLAAAACLALLAPPAVRADAFVCLVEKERWEEAASALRALGPDPAPSRCRSSARWNVPIHPSDVVNVPARTTVKIFCLGEVKQPGALEFSADDRMTLLSAVAKAGGLTDRASSRVRIRHRGPDGHDTESLANVSRIVAGKDENPRLSPDDVVIVKESFF